MPPLPPLLVPLQKCSDASDTLVYHSYYHSYFVYILYGCYGYWRINAYAKVSDQLIIAIVRTLCKPGCNGAVKCVLPTAHIFCTGDHLSPALACILGGDSLSWWEFSLWLLRRTE